MAPRCGASQCNRFHALTFCCNTCAASVYDWHTRQHAGPLGDELQSQACNDTAALQPSHLWVPWVVVNGQPIFDDMEHVQQYVCAAYTGPRCILLSLASFVIVCELETANRVNVKSQSKEAFIQIECFLLHIEVVIFPALIPPRKPCYSRSLQMRILSRHRSRSEKCSQHFQSKLVHHIATNENDSKAHSTHENNAAQPLFHEPRQYCTVSDHIFTSSCIYHPDSEQRMQYHL